MRPIFVAPAAVLFMLTPLAAQALKGNELKAAFSGKSGTWQSKDGKRSGTVTYNDNGTGRVTGNFGSFSEDTGVWRIRGNRFCAKWKRLRRGKEQCFSVRRRPDGSLDSGQSMVRLN